MGDGSSFVFGVFALALLALSCEEHGRNGANNNGCVGPHLYPIPNWSINSLIQRNTILNIE